MSGEGGANQQQNDQRIEAHPPEYPGCQQHLFCAVGHVGGIGRAGVKNATHQRPHYTARQQAQRATQQFGQIQAAQQAEIKDGDGTQPERCCGS